MNEYDDYLGVKDKPFAENINTALLLSNVFDLTVPIELPLMFRSGEWDLTPNATEKASVAIIETVDATGISTDGNNNLVGTGTLKFNFYPNFNSYGGISKVEWTAVSGTITIDIYDADGQVIKSDIPNGDIDSVSSAIRELQNFEFRVNFTSATLSDLKITMINNQETRWGAEVGISDVNGLDDELTSIHADINDITNNNTDWQDIPTYQFLDGTVRGMIRNGFAVIRLGVTANQNVTLPTELFELPPDFNPSARMELPVRMYKGGTDRIATIDLHSNDDDYYATLRTGTNLESGAGVTGTLVYPISDY